MGIHQITDPTGIALKTWDDDTRTFTDEITHESRPYTTEENERADALAAQEADEAAAAAIKSALDDAMTELQGILDMTNADINKNPAAAIKDNARALRNIIRHVLSIHDGVG